VAIPVGLGGTLELAGGYPIVRTKLGVSEKWRVTVHDPTTGRVLYEDHRP
jgi:hypothetical protein